MVERLLSMQEAQGSIPWSSTPFVLVHVNVYNGGFNRRQRRFVCLIMQLGLGVTKAKRISQERKESLINVIVHAPYGISQFGQVVRQLLCKQ
jgi:hypothetical protein